MTPVFSLQRPIVTSLRVGFYLPFVLGLGLGLVRVVVYRCMCIFVL